MIIIQSTKPEIKCPNCNKKAQVACYSKNNIFYSYWCPECGYITADGKNNIYTKTFK